MIASSKSQCLLSGGKFEKLNANYRHLAAIDPDSLKGCFTSNYSHVPIQYIETIGAIMSASLLSW
ncbi:MAG: hypothetical protein WC100_07700, partial [Sterolibacterium sp.]